MEKDHEAGRSTDGAQLPIPDITPVPICPAGLESVHGVIASTDDEHAIDILRLCEGIGYIDATTVLES